MKPPKTTLAATQAPAKPKQASALSSIMSFFQRTKLLLANNYKIIFFISIVIVLIYTLISLNLTLAQPLDETYRQEQLQATSVVKFDQKTIDRINGLNTLPPLAPGYQPPNPFAPKP